MDYFPGQPPQDDPRLYEITLEHLLTMTSGFYWPETEPVFPSWVEDAFLSGFPQDALFHSPIIYNPGTTFSYCTACTHLLSIILQEASGMLAQDFAQQYLMSPLGISAEEWSWNRIGGGHNSGGWGFYLTPRSMAKLGYLYLQEGEWDGLQVIPRDWVRQSRRSLVDDYYGYLWWVTMINGHPAFYANGHGGQYIYIFPSLDMVIVITQETRLHNGGEPTEILHDYFTPAVIAP